MLINSVEEKMNACKHDGRRVRNWNNQVYGRYNIRIPDDESNLCWRGVFRTIRTQKFLDCVYGNLESILTLYPVQLGY